jgi:hypothetical protein
MNKNAELNAQVNIRKYHHLLNTGDLKQGTSEDGVLSLETSGLHRKETIIRSFPSYHGLQRLFASRVLSILQGENEMKKKFGAQKNDMASENSSKHEKQKTLVRNCNRVLESYSSSKPNYCSSSYATLAAICTVVALVEKVLENGHGCENCLSIDMKINHVYMHETSNRAKHVTKTIITYGKRY